MAQANDPQIVLIDIDLNDEQGNGLDAARLINDFSKNAYIIFITGYAQYAVDAFEVHPYGYILKPVNIERFKKMILEIIQRLKRTTECENEVVNIKTPDEILHINKADILFVEKINRKSVIHTKARILETRKNLDEIGTLLGAEFMRVHRSFLINLKEIKSSRELSNRTFEVEFWDYPGKALMSRYHYQNYKNSLKML